MRARKIPRRIPSKYDRLVADVREQRAWIRDHGGNEAGYVAHYGEPGVSATWSGEGGRAIYRADAAHLVELEAQLEKLRRRR